MVLNVLGFLAVLTNASMITFVGDYDARSSNLVTNGFLERGQQWKLWSRFFIVEHCVLLLRVIILTISPSMPKWVGESKEILLFRRETRYKTAEEIRAERELKEEYAKKMQSGYRQLKLAMLGKGRAEVIAIFQVGREEHSRPCFLLPPLVPRSQYIVTTLSEEARRGLTRLPLPDRRHGRLRVHRRLRARRLPPVRRECAVCSYIPPTPRPTHFLSIEIARSWLLPAAEQTRSSCCCWSHSLNRLVAPLFTAFPCVSLPFLVFRCLSLRFHRGIGVKFAEPEVLQALHEIKAAGTGKEDKKTEEIRCVAARHCLPS
eukprot:SAG22_NODE_632_length_8376_cov_4.201160_6_plen_317_part_00